MLNYNTPLTAEESAFAAEHHHLLLSYLKKARLDFDEFYDIAVFGYLRAVRKYLARPELRAYQFSTIAFRAMSCDVHHSREYWLRGKRCGRIVQTLNDDQNADDLRDSVTESVDIWLPSHKCGAACRGDFPDAAYEFSMIPHPSPRFLYVSQQCRRVIALEFIVVDVC